jgi:hypothetical protein
MSTKVGTGFHKLHRSWVRVDGSSTKLDDSGIRIWYMDYRYITRNGSIIFNQMDGQLKEQLDRIERKLDELLELVPVIDLLGKLLIRSHEAAERLGLNKDTISQNDKIGKYEEVGHRRTYIEVGELQVIKKRKRKK